MPDNTHSPHNIPDTMFLIRPMSIDDYDSVINLMKQTPGVTFRDADSRENTARYLERNPKLSFVACVEKDIVGCIMSGHDGRRGYLQHLVVHPDYRKKCIASALVENCLSSLEKIGIHKSHVDVLKSNEDGSSYWESQGWKLRTDIDRYSFVRSGNETI
jgi:ribosomal protein S18 acetylase RimI-like enzyme